jgi:hypothetical protein
VAAESELERVCVAQQEPGDGHLGRVLHFDEAVPLGGARGRREKGD